MVLGLPLGGRGVREEFGEGLGSKMSFLQYKHILELTVGLTGRTIGWPSLCRPMKLYLLVGPPNLHIFLRSLGHT